MTTPEWLERAREQAPELKDLITNFHPVNRSPGRRPGDFITAPNAEWACTQIRKEIRQEEEGDPVASFETALAAGDVSRLMTLLNQTWFGVPESTDCWRLTGYAEAVDLLDDPPEDDENDWGI